MAVQCSFCTRTFSSNSARRQHERTHTGAKPFQCGMCAKSFAMNWIRRRHEKTVHTDDRNYVCNVCHETFNQTFTLNVHKRQHTNEKPYSCAYCPRRFRQPNSRIVHERTHTGEKPFDCRRCGKSFTQDSNRRRHEKKNVCGRVWKVGVFSHFSQNTWEIFTHFSSYNNINIIVRGRQIRKR